MIGSREVATIANGSLARSRIINATKSEKAQVNILLKFGVGVPYQKVAVFRKAIAKFIQDRPKEWICMVSFRSTRVEADLGFIEYVLVVQHRESWEKILVVLESKASVSSFCLELQNQLGMRYSAPPLPVDLGMKTSKERSAAPDDSEQGNTTRLNETQASPGSLDESFLSFAKMFEIKKDK